MNPDPKAIAMAYSSVKRLSEVSQGPVAAACAAFLESLDREMDVDASLTRKRKRSSTRFFSVKQLKQKLQYQVRKRREEKANTKMVQFDLRIFFKMGWNHQLETFMRQRYWEILRGGASLLTTYYWKRFLISHWLVGVAFATHGHAEQPCITQGELTWSSTEQLQEE